jgi:hypothetical protein
VFSNRDVLEDSFTFNLSKLLLNTGDPTLGLPGLLVDKTERRPLDIHRLDEGDVGFSGGVPRNLLEGLRIVR